MSHINAGLCPLCQHGLLSFRIAGDVVYLNCSDCHAFALFPDGRDSEPLFFPAREGSEQDNILQSNFQGKQATLEEISCFLIQDQVCYLKTEWHGIDSVI